MTDLQLGLLVIGAAAVAGVLIYNRVQERAVRRQAKARFASQHPDVLLDDASAQRAVPAEPALRRPSRADSAASDPKIDYVIELEGLTLSGVRPEWTALERRFAKRAFLCEPGEGRLQATLQMLSRSGVVSETDLLEFRSQVETIAARHGAAVAAPEMRQALEAAHRLDAACAEVDIQVALHVLGMEQTAGQAALPDGQAFQLARRADGVTLLLDVPRTAELMRSFEAMVRAAQQLAAAHGGRLVDDNGTALDERALAAIGAQLEAIGGRFSEMGVVPGSALALRLFS